MHLIERPVIKENGLTMVSITAQLFNQTCVNADMAKLVNLGSGMDLARGEQCEGVTKRGCIKKQDTRH